MRAEDVAESIADDVRYSFRSRDRSSTNFSRAKPVFSGTEEEIHFLNFPATRGPAPFVETAI